MNQFCEVLVRDDAIFVIGNRETYPAVRISGAPITRLDRAATANTLGQAVLDTLQAYRTGTPHPSADELKKGTDESLGGTGFKTWPALQRGALLVGIKSDGAEVEVTPSETDGKGRFASIEAARLHVVPEPKKIGAAILDAIPLCKTKSRLG